MPNQSLSLSDQLPTRKLTRLLLKNQQTNVQKAHVLSSASRTSKTDQGSSVRPPALVTGAEDVFGMGILSITT